jgi:hypothetical protein
LARNEGQPSRVQIRSSIDQRFKIKGLRTKSGEQDGGGLVRWKVTRPVFHSLENPMNRTLTAAVALAAAFGMASLAQAQTSTQSSPMTTSPSASQPGMSGTQNPATTIAPGTASGTAPGTAPSATGTYGASPQANTNQMNMAPQGSATRAGATPAASQSQIQQAQEQLKSAGLYRGSVDGVMGPETQTALMKFQREQGLPETAQLDQQTTDRLSGSSGGSATSPSATRSGATPSMTPNSTMGGSSSTAPSGSGSYNR